VSLTAVFGVMIAVFFTTLAILAYVWHGDDSD